VTVPKPAQRRPRGPLTEREKRDFLETVAAGWSLTRAAERAGRNVRRFYDLRERDEEFAAAWDEAIVEGKDRLDDVNLEYATEGVEEVTYDGEGNVVRRVKRPDPATARELLRGRRPEVYRDSGPAVGALVVVINERTLGELDVAGAPGIVEGRARKPSGEAS
jgi:hypothetical protein